jgi:hypothetical protein
LPHKDDRIFLAHRSNTITNIHAQSRKREREREKDREERRTENEIERGMRERKEEER